MCYLGHDQVYVGTYWKIKKRDQVDFLFLKWRYGFPSSGFLLFFLFGFRVGLLVRFLVNLVNYSGEGWTTIQTKKCLEEWRVVGG